MKIAVLGASGFIGKAVVSEALKKNYTVYAVSRSGAFEDNQNLVSIHHDVNDWEALSEQVKDVDAIISTFNGGWKNPNLYEDFIQGSHSIIQLAKKLDKHLLIVGGASSLYDTKTNKQFYYGVPSDFQAMVKGAFDLYHELIGDTSFKWTFISPALNLTETPATYDYNIGGDYVLTDNSGASNASIYDLADLLLKSLGQEHLYHKRITLADK